MSEKKTGETIVKLGNLQYGQTKDFIIPMVLSKEPNYLAVILEYEGYEEGIDHKISFMATGLSKNFNSISAYVRNRLVGDTLQSISEFSNGKTVKGKKILEGLQEIVEKADNFAENEDPRLNGFHCDLVGFGEKGGRMLKAISTNVRFNRWGAHYLRSICRAHQLQLCTNFIDVGLEVYGGKMFKELQEIGGKIFLRTPMVKTKISDRFIQVPSQVQNQYQYQNQNQNQNNYQEDQNQDYYSGGGGGCFEENCNVSVLLEDQTVITKKISQVKHNDLLLVSGIQNNKVFAKVLCVIKLKLRENEELVEFPKSGLRLTIRHPVKFENKWQYPIDIVNNYKGFAIMCEKKATYVYNFILEHSHVLFVNGMQCVTFGHEIKEAYHEFYGPKEVLSAIASLPGYKDGMVNVEFNLRKYHSFLKTNI